ADLEGIDGKEVNLRPFVQECRKLAGWTTEQLWQELLDFAERSKAKRYVGEIDHGYADLLIRTLAPHAVPDTQTLGRLLAPDPAEADAGWLEIFLVALAGHRRVREAVPHLVRKSHIDTDFLLERCTRALASIGDGEAARLIGAAWPGEQRWFATFTAA